MKLTTRLIRAQVDFEYGKNKGLGYIAIFIQFATFIEVLKVNRLWYLILIPSAITATWLWGVFLRKINYRKREIDFINHENPMLSEIHKSINKQ